MHSDPTDLIHRAQQGDRAAFEALYRAHAGRVYALCLRLTADAAQAEERTQDAFVRAWERLATYRGESAFSSWLYRLTVNEVLLGRRAERRREQRVGATDDPAAGERPRGAGPRSKLASGQVQCGTCNGSGAVPWRQRRCSCLPSASTACSAFRVPTSALGRGRAGRRCKPTSSGRATS